MMGKFTKFVDFFVPQWAKADPEDMRRARGLIILALFLFPWWPGFALSYSEKGVPVLFYFTLTVGFLLLVTLPILKYGSSLKAPTHFLVVLVTLNMFLNCALDGGLECQASFALFCTPIMAIYFAGSRAGWFWVSVVLAFFAVIYGYETHVQDIPRLVAESEAKELYLTNVFAVSLIITFSMARYDSLRTTSYKEILSQKQTLTELLAKNKMLTQKLAVASRTAGMSEVASGVLHDVGNVLNSVNVSVETAQKVANRGWHEGYGRLMGLFSGKEQGLDQVLGEGKGKAMMTYLKGLEKDTLSHEKTLIQELEQLKESVGRIGQVVRQQEQFVRKGQVIEEVILGDLVDEAVKLAEGGVVGPRVAVKVRGDRQISVNFDRHILLNSVSTLVSNAWSAVKGAKSPSVDVYMERNAAGAVCIEVSDTRDHIDLEAQNRAFQGDTRSGGAAHELHRSANLIQSMGGRMGVRTTEKKDQVVFFVELPVEPVSMSA